MVLPAAEGASDSPAPVVDASADSDKAETPAAACVGELPEPPAGFVKVDAPGVVKQAEGEPGKGRLCQGVAYRVAGFEGTIYRAYNSTNPGSRLGEWWSLEEPAGSVAKYREDFEICYQWSPLDMLVSCKLREGAIVVLGTGQSAVCSEYLNYPASSAAQLYLSLAETDALDCSSSTVQFSWSPVGD